MPRDDVGHVAGEQAVAVLLGVQQPEARPGERLGAKREPGGIERRRNDAERRQGAGLRGSGRRQHVLMAEQMQKPRRDQREGRGERDDAPRRRQRRFERHHHKPDRGERGDAAGFRGDRRDEAGQRQRGEHMRALVLSGARKVIGGEDRQHQPGEHDDFKAARDAARDDVERKRRQRHHAADQPRRNERAMARCGQRVVQRRRMHQRIDIVADRLEQAQLTPRPSSADALPSYGRDRVRGHLSEC